MDSDFIVGGATRDRLVYALCTQTICCKEHRAGQRSHDEASRNSRDRASSRVVPGDVVDSAVRILLVEDSPDDAFLLASHLRQERFEATYDRVQTADELRSALARGPWDRVIADYSLPSFSAPEALDVLKESGLDLPFIVVSGSIGEETAVALMHAGAHDYVLKQNLARLVPAIQRERRDAEHRRLRQLTASENQRLENERADLLERLKQENEDLNALTQITANAVSTLALDDLVRTLLGRVVEVMGADAATILLTEGQELRQLASYGPASLGESTRLRTIGEGFEGKVAATLKPVCIDDASSDPLITNPIIRARGLKCLIAVPLKRNGDLIGVLHAGWVSPRHRRERDVHMLEITAERCAAAIQNARLFQDLQKAVNEVRESERRFRLLAETINEVFWITDPKKQEMVYISPAYERIWGRTCASLYALPQSWLDAIHADDRSRVLEELRLQPTGDYDTEYRIMCPDGSIRHVHDRAFAVQDAEGSVYRIVGLASDVTARREAEASKRASEGRFEAIFDAEPECVKVVAADGSLVQMNRAGLDMLEATSIAEVRARGLLEFIAPPYRVDFEALRQRCLAGESGRMVFEVIGLRGARRWLETHAVPLPETNGNIAKVLSVTRDITAEKNAEDAFRQSLRDQEALLKEVHHRVKNNLQLIVSLLRIESRRHEETATQHVLKDMQGRIQSMALLHETLYRSGSYADVELSSYLEKLGAQLLRTLKPGQPSIRVDNVMSPVMVGMDQAIPCGLLLHELLSNCLKHAFANQDHGTVKVELGRVGDGAEVRLRVSDDGAGLPPDFKQRSGKSLGLQLVSDLSRQLNGRFEIEDGPGAAFAVTFRVAQVERMATVDLGSIAKAFASRGAQGRQR